MLRVALIVSSVACAPQAVEHGGAGQGQDVARWKARAANVTIIRDNWGIPHVYGKTDADAVFGLMYAQAEDDFKRVEQNYLTSIGRLAEAEGEAAIYRDLRMKLFIDPVEMKALYAASPAWLRVLMDAYADGLNYYLHTHSDVKPRVITRFEPWMALTFSEGSIGGDIESIELAPLEAFYGKPPQSAARFDAGFVRPAFVRAVMPAANESDGAEPGGSNGIAIAPSMSRSRHALLLINPHTSFYFRAEARVASEEGLNAYGAITWGQFFIYQGFNETSGWMHTSSGADNIDEYLETVVRKGDAWYYRYGAEDRPLKTTTITVPYRTANGMATKAFTVYRSHHGPIVREVDGKWVSVRLMQEPLKALTQSYLRTKATNYAGFRDTMELHTNSSNNTVFADAEGNIAYFHSNFIPRRDSTLDWSKPVDGSNPAAEWHGLLSIDETPGLLNPSNGWLYNTNNWPWTAAGADSPKREAFPRYVERNGENPRGLHAIKVLAGKKDFTLDSLTEAAFDSLLPAFEEQIPALLKAWERTPDANPLKANLADQIALLRKWDFRWGVASIATTLAVYWGEEVARAVADEARKAGMPPADYIVRKAPPGPLLQALSVASDKLTADFGNWRTPWGDINRFQRLTGDIVHPFNDAGPSIPVGFTASRWGSLASFVPRANRDTRKIFGTTGNSFVAVVEFGDRVRARAITAGGQSGDPASPHFIDQAVRYSTGNLREVYFYRSELEGHTERTYHPGE